MERGVVVGGALIALSVLAAVALNSQGARRAAAAAEANAECNESKPRPAVPHPGNTSTEC